MMEKRTIIKWNNIGIDNNERNGQEITTDSEECVKRFVKCFSEIIISKSNCLLRRAHFFLSLSLFSLFKALHIQCEIGKRGEVTVAVSLYFL